MAEPIIIAHRGASGYLPEHSIAAKTLAYGQGADYLEQDVVATRDGELVVLHDLFLDDVSDVRERFPGRARKDGHFYVVDFDLAELETLRFGERRRPGQSAPRFPGRFAADEVAFRIVPLRTELILVRELNRVTGRKVGIYAEIKAPRWHREHGFDLSRRLLDLLTEFGYTAPEDAAFVQCFDAAELERVRRELGSRLRLVQLVDEWPEDPGLERIAAYADAVGPPYASLIEIVDGAPQALELARRIRRQGLFLHPYTFRRDALDAGLGLDLEGLLEFFYCEVGVDGVFTDHPDLAVQARDTARRSS